MKSILLLGLIVISGALFGQRVEPENELLWEITSPQGTKSYLYGSLHSNDRRLFDFSDSTYIALSHSKVIALELDISELYRETERTGHMLNLNFDNEGEPYTNSVTPSQTKYGDEDGMPQFLDAYFQQYAENSGKELYALETLELQRSLLNNASISDLSELRIENFLTSGDKMIELYLKGDIYRLHDLMKNSLSVYNDMYTQLIVERNKQMTEKLSTLLRENQVFCAVGAGHLAGDAGLIRGLRAKGFKLRKVMATYSGQLTNAKQSVKEKRNYVYTNDTLGMKMVFPGKPYVAATTDSDVIIRLCYSELGQGNSYIVEVYGRTFDTGLSDLADRFIASPANSPAKEINIPNGGEAIEGLADTYPEGYSWTRILMTEDLFIVMKAYGGNKFMNSPRPFRFFDQLELF